MEDGGWREDRPRPLSSIFHPPSSTFAMKPPPLLLAAALLFWGWQTDLFKAGLLMALILESARLTKARWEFSDDDFARLWTFCTLLFLGTAVFAFTSNEGLEHFLEFFNDPNPSSTSGAGNASALAAAAFFRWLPMTFFLFVAAQTFSTREVIPLNTIDLIMRIRWKRDARLGRPLPPARGVNVAYPYFAICLFSASIHEASANSSYFWGLCVLLMWALWLQRSPRYGLFIWAGALAFSLLLGFGGQIGILQLTAYFGRMNPQWLSQFMQKPKNQSQSSTAIGRIGQLKLSGKIVIRIEPEVGQVPEYLREACYRAYRQPVWYAGRSREDFDPIAPDSTTTTWRLIQGKTNSSAIQIGCYLDGGTDLLPLPEDCGQLENLQAYSMRKNSAGTVRAEGPRVLVFDALYGPGPMIDSPPDTNQDLSVPDNETAALDKLISEMHFTSTNLAYRLRTVNNHFQEKFNYSIWQERPNRTDSNETALGRFLLKTRSGHCEYFATATALLLRRMGIPTRYTVGFAVHEKSGSGYVVRLRDAHAWCLVWNERLQTWQDFDTTPASWVNVEEERKSFFEWLSDFWAWVKFQFTKFRYGQTHLRKYILMALVPLLLLLLFQIFFRQKRRRYRQAAGAMDISIVWPGLDSEFYAIEKKLAARGVPRQVNEPLTDWLERATHNPALKPLRKPLRELLRLHYRCRFDPRGLNAEDREALRRGARKVLNSLGEN